jgi:hypothetical protein
MNYFRTSRRAAGRISRALARGTGRWLNGSMTQGRRTGNDSIAGYAFAALAMVTIIVGQAVGGGGTLSVILVVTSVVVLAAAVIGITRILVLRRRAAPRPDGADRE